MAQMYTAQPLDRYTSAGPSSKRNPLTNTVNQAPDMYQYQAQAAQKQQEREKEKQKANAPPLPRQNAKVTPPSPPRVITDKNGRFSLNRVGFLGEGGFARVYEVEDHYRVRHACKVITKSSLKTKKAKTKLYAEIKIHRSLEHPNIVHFEDCFEDDENVYMTLELCTSGSLMDMLRRRRRFTEPEARFFIVQLAGACHYMHTHQVIHRDLKLGNLFLDKNMNLKVGDFGLAALIENPGERKKTVCGTPNYIAPEVLFDTANGHSFEVDTWSIGVILYTLVVGRPPFQTSDVKAIYQRIRDNDYQFPSERSISSHVQHLITQILTTDPTLRPSLHDIVDHPWFTHGVIPLAMPASAHDTPPDFKHVSRSTSQSNLKKLRRQVFLDEDPSQSMSKPDVTMNSSAGMGKNITSTIAQQEKEFQKAVQPGSPISALLSSARQPLLMSSIGTGGGAGKDNLLRKLQSVRESPLGKKSLVRNLDGTIEDRGVELGASTRIREPTEEDYKARKELEAQKARIVAQMAPVREEEEDMMYEDEDVPQAKAPRETARMKPSSRFPISEQENVPPQPVASLQASASIKSKESRYAKAPLSSSIPAPSSKSLPPLPSQSNLSGFENAAQVLTLAFEAKSTGRVFRDPRQDPSQPLAEERVFIVSWVDYCNKYGMGYALTDGSCGVYFNDSTSIILSPNKRHFDYVSVRKQATARKSYTVDQYPEELKTKVYLLKHFEGYIMKKLYGDYDYTYHDEDRTKGMEWVVKYLRMKQVIVFKLSHDVLQFNFYDHSKLILSSHGLAITHIDKNYRLTRWTLAEVMANSLQPSRFSEEENKFTAKLVDKLRYCKEVLVNICNASVAGRPLTDEGETAVGTNVGSNGLAAGSTQTLASATNTISSKMSKVSLR